MDITINNPSLVAMASILMFACLSCLCSKPKKNEESHPDSRHDSYYSISNRKK
tara:strand:- start:1291 stop:1449 length:159 start_codon:yes stop_codon:yes gene_type:complete